jgi:hypothetical protein
MNPPAEPMYVLSLEEIFWGSLLITITMTLHGFGMLGILRIQERLKEKFHTDLTFRRGMCLLVLASWMILFVHLVEVIVWAMFFYWKGAVNQPGANPSLCYYFALNEYTTLGSNYNLIQHWRLLEGMISMTGLMTFAWSTGVLLTLAQDFQDQSLARFKRRLHTSGEPPAKS